MIITTSSKIWSHPSFLTLVHQVNEIIEREAGAKSESLAVHWEVLTTKDRSGFSLQVTVVDAAAPQAPFSFAEVGDLLALAQAFRQWCGK